MPNIHDIAAFILQEKGEMSTMKLQKLCYFSQGWTLAWTDQALFREDFRAWANGPVARELYNEHRGQYSVSELALGDADALSGQQKLMVRTVLNSYGQMSGFQLSELTHKGAPWKDLRAHFNVADGARCDAIIDKESMKQYFRGLSGV